MDVFNKENVHIKNRDRVEEIVSQLIKGSASKLQIISDFDHTISRVHQNGKQCSTTYGIFKQSSLTSEEYKKKSTGLYNHYHPIEVDPHLTKEEKEPYMIEWYTKSRNLMPSSGITKDCVSTMVQKSNIQLRDGCEVLFESLHKHDVPLLIFSAGVGDVLKEVLEQRDLMYPNIKIIANFMRFDEKNKLMGFKGDLIHTFNKNLSSIENKDYFNHLKSRNNVILLGDSLGDLDMAAGAEDVNVILKIGFLNFKTEENLPRYLDAFDIVLSDDQTMDVIIGLLQHIL
ncbi:7-methylguanosine phosphate-specific 5'-nucleotidase-like isoform X2 [Argiope bruennichi]|uniref:5'-nucleotidase n=2 Tax=Argiope bruennichi TaxID=94029 RepID=A0A8T0F8Y7_ARGBR|nr:7-methylguanosine phosphate-specific 5'-nucleotidase-like isoform X2 [Argiope bruennichi]XP_055943036.1 7-methylguanosine phosphate-specific 5'-nucleotidase-like isoform X2 [Argiope bruennichi]XP_055943037.1 7-methylguanosine phosphate-specific 5'-nucleotidase-like isoform X2 [Argiope bruennichi]XP_055943038.1 7-methylguanosine phosphate-specific 5'-nucleotidase-like isoform X2 [Argiope bruennichi]KAF8786778.1 7-methylguanosine phosphate-specific like protein [Argiope bruennichi]